jgi:thymidylate synthase
MNKLDYQYIALLNDILANGVRKEDRTGTGTISVFGRQIRHKMSEGFPLLTTKKMPWKTIVTELLWFLNGDTNIKYLVDNNCHIWDGDAYKNYCTAYKDGHEFYEDEQVKRSFTQEEFINKIKTDDEFAKIWGELGPIYGNQWRHWGEYEIDQITNLISDLKSNPDSRRLMVTAWNPDDLPNMVLPPCHYGFQMYTRVLSFDERWALYSDKPYDGNGLGMINTLDYLDDKNIPTRAISLMWNQRSVDTFLGLPFNIASYGLLLEIIAREVNMIPDELIGNLGDVHLYSNHVEQAREQIGGPLDHTKRTELLKEAMGLEAFEKAVSELVPFGGGMSEYYQAYKIPYNTREPYPLPSLRIMDYDSTLSVIENLEHWTPTDFVIENYQSHPTIKAPLSN